MQHIDTYLELAVTGDSDDARRHESFVACVTWRSRMLTLDRRLMGLSTLDAPSARLGILPLAPTPGRHRAENANCEERKRSRLREFLDFYGPVFSRLRWSPAFVFYCLYRWRLKRY